MTEIENISDTARWVAVYRAMETARADAIFNDPFASRLAGEKGAAIVDTMKSGRAMAWAMIVRTAVFDEIILDYVRRGEVDSVLNLAAGLDARAWRMPLPPTLRWIDVDLPGILDYKVDMLKDERAACRYEAVRLDLRSSAKRQALFAQVGAESKRTLVVSEGLLVYLTAKEVAALSTDLYAAKSFQWWVFDIVSPQLLQWMVRSWGERVERGNAPFQFAPAENTRFFEPQGWKEVQFRSAMDDARRLRREMRLSWLFRLIGRLSTARRKEEFKRFSGIAQLERM